MSEWQPIETAPKDGTHVLILEDGDAIEAHWGGQFWEPIKLAYHGCGCCGGYQHAPDPKSWAPLPDPPKK